MRAFFALVLREISERRALLAAAAVASVLPVLAPLLPATGSNPAADVRELVMWIMVGFLVPLFALLLGVSFIGRDLSEGRMGFYFAQPLSGPTIWFGKLTAVALLIWGAQVLIMLPTVLLAQNPARLLAPEVTRDLPWKTNVFGWTVAETFGPYASLAVWLVPLGIVLIAHAVGVVWRGRSAWLVLDLIAALVVAVGAWWALRPFLPSVAPIAGATGLLWLVAWVLLGLITAGAVQLTVGRVDLRRGHRALSTSAWAILAIAVATLSWWSVWVRSATPADLLRADRVMVASGEWIAVRGPSIGRLDYHTLFVLNSVDGRWVRAGSAPNRRWYGSRVWFSGDGVHAFWAGPSIFGFRDLKHLDLEDPNLEVRALGLDLTEDGSRVAVSHEGDRIAVVEKRTTAVYDVDTGTQLAAVVISGEFEPNYCWFDDRETVLISASTPWGWNGIEGKNRSKILRFDVHSKTLTDGEEEQENTDYGPPPKTLVAHGRRHVERVKRDTGDTLALVDAESGELVADLGRAGYSWEIRNVDDGRYFLLRKLYPESVVEFFDADGALLQRIDFGGDSSLSFAGEVAPGRLMLGARSWVSDENRLDRYQARIVNTETGIAETAFDGFYPLQGRNARLIEAVGNGAWHVGSVASRLLEAEDGSLHLLDPETGTLKQLIPAIG